MDIESELQKIEAEGFDLALVQNDIVKGDYVVNWIDTAGRNRRCCRNHFDGHVIRIGPDWQISGQCKCTGIPVSNCGYREAPFSLSINEATNVVEFVVDDAVFRFSTTDHRIQIANNQEKGELLIRFRQDLKAPNGNHSVREGSWLYAKDQ